MEPDNRLVKRVKSRINNYIAQIRYSDNGLLNYLNVGVSGSLIFKEDADEIRTAFRKAGIFSTTYWQPSGYIPVTKGIGKVKRAKQWVIRHREQLCYWLILFEIDTFFGEHRHETKNSKVGEQRSD
ncbi:hypothetical protein [Methylophilus sp.]|uniref:hypothetical protein n=1 Tax=Methylophilus sp. TaxID=29541 RepID=UPI0025E77EEA|nr:hypothetical protein [Methylophilus sp.]